MVYLVFNCGVLEYTFLCDFPKPLKFFNALAVNMFYIDSILHFDYGGRGSGLLTTLAPKVFICPFAK